MPSSPGLETATKSCVCLLSNLDSRPPLFVLYASRSHRPIRGPRPCLIDWSRPPERRLREADRPPFLLSLCLFCSAVVLGLEFPGLNGFFRGGLLLD